MTGRAGKRPAAKKKSRFRISYNAPVTLTFSLAAAAVMVLDTTFLKGIAETVFAVPGRPGSLFAFDFRSAFDYVRLFIHVFAHADWGHLTGNLSFILLLGPLLEERYGPAALALMMTMTALVTGVVNICFLPAGLMGASGIAFMMILLASFASLKNNSVPLTFILVLALYMGREIAGGFESDTVSPAAHIAGAVCGSMFGFISSSPASGKNQAPVRRRTAARAEAGNVSSEEAPADPSFDDRSGM